MPTKTLYTKYHFCVQMAGTISVRIGREELAEIATLSRVERKKKSEILRDVLMKGLREKKVEAALEKYRKGEATASKAAQIAGVPLSTFLDVLFERKTEFNYSLEDFREDIKGLK